MRDFSISPTVAAWTAITLMLAAMICYGAAVMMYAGYAPYECCSTVRGKAFYLSAVLAFGTTSLFYARKIYLILFRNSESSEAPSRHNVPFVIYVLLRPIFGSLVSLLFLLTIEGVIRGAVDAPHFSEGFVSIAIVSAILLSAVLGPALDALPKAGKRLASKLGDIAPNGEATGKDRIRYS
jgi:hypothetical protein